MLADLVGPEEDRVLDLLVGVGQRVHGQVALAEQLDDLFDQVFVLFL